MRTGLLAILALAALVSSKTVVQKSPANEMQWWQHSIVYQIYPRSYKDTDDDGTGDLKGIESKLPYFSELGIQAIWLSPIYKSPMKDFGYDISDFRDIDPTFGTLDDFKSLLKSAHNFDIKIVMDYVPNHSSDEHEWFVKSLAKEEPYTDYYVWVDPKGFDEQGNPIPPSNWVSVFRYSAWEYREERGQFYLHQFVVGQPDLNYRNPLVLEEMKDVFRFWLDLGVDGFRMDAVVHMWEDDRWLDEPLSDQADSTSPDDYGHYDHIYTNNLPETRALLKEMYDVVKTYGNDKVMMLEAYLSPTDMIPFYECGDYPFNFGFFGFSNAVTAEDVLNNIDNMIKNVPEGKFPNWVLGNHDVTRIGSRVGEHLIDALNLITLTLPGMAVTYQGEEIGMTGNYDISFEETVDPAGCNCGPDDYQKCSRDPERTPMQWSGVQANAGFSNAQKTWLPVNKNYVDVNVETETGKPKSHLEIYKQMVGIRYSDPVFLTGEVKLLNENGVLIVGRLGDNVFYRTFVTVVNFNDFETNVDINGDFHPILEQGLVVVASGNTYEVGNFVDLNSFTLAAYESVVLWIIEI